MKLTSSKSQHKKLPLEKNILPPLLPGLELATFRSRVRCSYQQAIPALTGSTSVSAVLCCREGHGGGHINLCSECITGALFASVALMETALLCLIHCGVCYRGTVRQHRSDGDSQHFGVQYAVQRCLWSHGSSRARCRLLHNGGDHLAGLPACPVSTSCFSGFPSLWGTGLPACPVSTSFFWIPRAGLPTCPVSTSSFFWIPLAELPPCPVSTSPFSGFPSRWGTGLPACPVSTSSFSGFPWLDGLLVL